MALVDLTAEEIIQAYEAQTLSPFPDPHTNVEQRQRQVSILTKLAATGDVPAQTTAAWATHVAEWEATFGITY